MTSAIGATPSGNLIPIYDPATLRPDGRGGFIKDQFMGCDGNTPNVICPDRINPIVQPWLAALPTPTSAGTLNNFLAPPIPDTILGDSDYYMGRRGCAGGQQPRVRQLLAPACAGEVLFAVAAGRLPPRRIPTRRIRGSTE